MDLEHSYFECRCTDFGHVFRLTLDPDDGDLYLDVNLDCYLPWYKRMWVAIKYVFGYHHSCASYDSTIIKYEDLPRMKDIFDRSEQLTRQRLEASGRY